MPQESGFSEGTTSGERHANGKWRRQPADLGEEISGKAQKAYQNVKDFSEKARDEAAVMAKTHPVRTVLGLVGMGIAFAYLLRKVKATR